MAIRRYSFTSKIKGGKLYATSATSQRIYNAVQSGVLPFNTYVLRGGERLDTVAGRAYGDSSLWWVIAAASGIGWGLQVPVGTVLYVPQNIGQVATLTR